MSQWKGGLTTKQYGDVRCTDLSGHRGRRFKHSGNLVSHSVFKELRQQMKRVPDSPLWFEREDINERTTSLNYVERDFSKTCSTVLISSTLISLWSLMTQRVFLAAASRRQIPTERLAYTADKFWFEPKFGPVSSLSQKIEWNRQVEPRSTSCWQRGTWR